MVARASDVSPNALVSGPDGQYGYQGETASFPAGATPGGAGLFETQQPSATLWDVSVEGRNVVVDLSWGTHQSRQIAGLRPPLRVQVAGVVSVRVRQRDAAEVGYARGSLTAATAPTCSVARTVQSVGALPDTAARVIALDAATVSVGGVAVVLAAGERLAVVDGSSVVAGNVVVEHEV